MGYRRYLGKVPKTFKKEVAGLSAREVDDKFSCTYKPTGYTEFLNIVDYGSVIEETTPVYDFDIYADEESEFGIISKEQLEQLIDGYKRLIKKARHQMIYKLVNSCGELIEEQRKQFIVDQLVVDENDFNVCFDYSDKDSKQGIILSCLSQLLHESTRFAPNLDSNSPVIMDGYSDLDDYLNLISIYKSFDWENDYLILSGR